MLSIMTIVLFTVSAKDKSEQFKLKYLQDEIKEDELKVEDWMINEDFWEIKSDSTSNK